MKNINEYLNEGFFSNVGGSLDSVKKLLEPIFELNNPNRKKYLNRSIISDILDKLPKKFGFNIYKYYKYDKSQTKLMESIKVTKEEDDLFWVRYSDDSGTSASHCDTEITSTEVHPFYFTKNPLKVVMTYNDEEVK